MGIFGGLLVPMFIPRFDPINVSILYKKMIKIRAFWLK